MLDAVIIKGVLLSLGCMAIYFSVPLLYYSRFFKTALYFGACLGCLMLLTHQRQAFLPGLVWSCFILLFSYYAAGSRWYMSSVMNLTLKEWEKQLEGSSEPDQNPTDRQRQILRHVAESWNPRWSEKQLDALLENAETLDQLIQNIQNRQWKSVKEEQPT